MLYSMRLLLGMLDTFSYELLFQISKCNIESRNLLQYNPYELLKVSADVE